MRRLVGISCLVSLLAVCLAVLTGCFGISQSPSYFPWLLPAKDIIRTHGKPGGLGYFQNFDPHACRLEVKPIEAINPVRTQHVLIATVYDEKGQPRRNRRVEWILEGVGNIVEVDESGYFPGRGYKVDNRYAVSYTEYCQRRIRKHGSVDSPDDIIIYPGQTWCVISSAVEGDTHVTAYCPAIADWDKHKVFVVKHWVDAAWVFPKPAVNRAGTEHVFTTKILRNTDRQPLARYRVRYRIIDGPPAHFLPDKTQEYVAESDLSGLARCTLAQVAPAQGTNNISVEIIRPPDPNATSGVGMVIARGMTYKKWEASAIAINKTGPATGMVGQEIPYTITVVNPGAIETRALTVRDLVPDGLQYVRSNPPATVDGKQLVWTLGELSGMQNRTIEVVFRATRVGPVTNTVTVVTEEGLKDEKSVTTQITEPQIRVTKTGPATGVVGVPITYQITVTNPGSGPATNVLLRDQFDPGLVHEKNANPVELLVGTLGAGESKTVSLVLTPTQPGILVNRVEVSADGNLSSRAEHPVTVHEAKLALKKTGPPWRFKDGPAEWKILVSNPGDVPVTNIVVRDALPPQLTFVNASEGGRLEGGQVFWNVGTLQPKQERLLQLTTTCAELSPKVVNVVTATADAGVQASAQAEIEIRGIPSFRMELIDTNDPVEVGKETSYKITVTNQGSLAGDQVQITAEVPKEMKIVNVQGPSQYTIEGQRVIFQPVDGVQPRQSLNYSIDVQALVPGDVRFQAWLRGATLTAPVHQQESTTIIPPLTGPKPVTPPVPAPPPGPTAAPGPNVSAQPQFMPARRTIATTGGAIPPVGDAGIPIPPLPPN